MTRKLYSLLFFLICSLSVRATHMSGGEIYWECIGPNQYRITLVVYRDCAGINVQPNTQLDITSPCGNYTLNVSTPGSTELSQLCDLQLPNSTCNGGSLPGIEQYIYTGTITLPPCDSWTISWTNNWRNNAIMNLQTPGAQPMYIEGVMNNAIAPCNDSPTFTSLAIPYVCLGYPVTYSYGTVDAEGDSLSYQLIDARNASGSLIPYVFPYTAQQPITGLTLDPVTGLLSFTCNLAGNWVVVIQVNEYDANGNLIGTIMRDMQFVVYPCSNIPPDPTTGTVNTLTGNAVQTAPYAIEVCESGNFCFDAVITDANPNNVLEATTNITSNLPGATFSYTGINPITCHICWTATPGSAGFYPFIVTVNDGACPIVAYQTYVYSVHVLNGVHITTWSTNESCAGLGDGSVVVNVLDGIGPYQYAWSNGSTSPIQNVGAGTYGITVTDSQGCISAPGSETVSTSPPPTANAGPDLVACFGTWPIALQGATTNASTNVWSNGTGIFSGVFPNVQYTPSAAEIANGGVDLILTANSASACPPASDMMHLSISNSFINASISAVNATCNGGTNGSATFTPDSPLFTYLWNTTPVQTTATATNLGAGTYSVLVTDQLNCNTTLSASVTAPAAITIANVQVTGETCAGNGDGTITVTASGGTLPYYYNWSNGYNTSSITVGAGTYVVAVTDANGCAPASATATVVATSQPNVANAGPDVIGCQSALPVALQGSVVNATSGAWSGGGGGFIGSGLNVQYMPSNTEVINGGVDLYFTTVGNTACPPDMDTVHISLSNSFLNATISEVDATCNGATNGSATFSPNSPLLTYQWNDPAGQITATASNLGAGNYSVLVTDQLNCTTTLSTMVTAPAVITIANVQVTNETCAGNGDGTITVTANGGTAPYYYNWSNGASTASITVGAGTYTVSITDANNCAPATTSANVIAASQPNIANAGADQIVCPGSYPIALQGTVVNATSGTWSGGSGSFNSAGLSPHYSPAASEVAVGWVDLILTTTGNTNCPADADTVHITLPNDLLNASVSANGTTCAGGNNGTAIFQPSSPAFTYLWNDPAAQTTPTANGLTSGTYTVHVTDPFGCDTTLSVTITQPPALAITSVQAVDPTCANGTNGTATATVTGGTPGYSYQWSANAGGQITSTATNLGDGTFIIVVTDANGCTTQANATLTSPTPITLSAQAPDTVCVNAPVQLTAQAGGGIGNYTITWSGIGFGTSLSYSFPFSQIVHVSVTDGAGCTGPSISLPVYVLDLSLASLTAFGDTVVCPGSSAHVSAIVNNYPGMVTIIWPQLGYTGSGPFTVPITQDRTITVMATDVCGNSLGDTLHIHLDVPPSISLPPMIAEGCEPLVVTMPDSLTTQTVSYVWNFGDGNTSTEVAPTHTYMAGSYAVSLVITTAAGCSAPANNTGQVIVHPSPHAEFSASPWQTAFDQPSIDFSNSSTGGVTSNAWTFGDGGTSGSANPNHTFTDIGVFNVQLVVSNSFGCMDSIMHPVAITPVYDITIPNAFSPNPLGGNGGAYDPTDLSNDIFYPFVRFVKDFNMRIWNRWGELVFESDNVRRGWDGYYRGQLSQQDVYVYRMQVRFVDDREVERMGDLTLFR